MLKLIRASLSSGVLVGGVVGRTGEGTPQGGPLSPLLANIVLDELDKELERRGPRFVRYADDVAIVVWEGRSARGVPIPIGAGFRTPLSPQTATIRFR